MSELNHPKNQHYVSQFLLNNFQIDSTNQIYCFDKTNDKIFKTNIKNVACEKWFYDIDEGNPNSSLEQDLSQLEGRVAPIINEKILRNKSIRGLTDDDFLQVALFIAVQILRTRSARQSLKCMDELIQRELVEIGSDIDKIQNYKKIETEKELKEIAISNIKTVKDRLVPHILDKVWMLYESNNEFIISDNPIGFQNTVNKDEFRGTIGLAVRGIEIYLPLSPQYNLGLLCRKTFNEMKTYFTEYYRELDSQGSFELRNFVNSIRRKTPVKCFDFNVENINSIQVLSSERFIFSNNNNFSLAKEMINKNKEVKHGPRPKMAKDE